MTLGAAASLPLASDPPHAQTFEASRAGDYSTGALTPAALDVGDGWAATNWPCTPLGDQGLAATDTGASVSTQDRIDAVVVGRRAPLEHNRDDDDEQVINCTAPTSVAFMHDPRTCAAS